MSLIKMSRATNNSLNQVIEPLWPQVEVEVDRWVFGHFNKRPLGPTRFPFTDIL